MFKSFWNGRFFGLPGFLFLVLSRSFQILLDKVYYYFVKNNLGRVGNNTIILRGLRYRFPNSINIGNNVTIGSSVTFSSELETGFLEIEDNVVIGRDCHIDFSGGVVIGSRSLLSEGVRIQSHDHGLDPRSKPIGNNLNIGVGVWIGMQAIILSNCQEIGNESVIGAGSLVTNSVPPNVVVAGVPAKTIKQI